MRLEKELQDEVVDAKEGKMNKKGQDDLPNIRLGIEEHKLVNGKKCQYYSKGRCLVKKERCVVQNTVCHNYKYKDDSMLKYDVDSCRFYKKESRMKKCSVSDRNGCIGEELCKFYQKKNRQI